LIKIKVNKIPIKTGAIFSIHASGAQMPHNGSAYHIYVTHYLPQFLLQTENIHKNISKMLKNWENLSGHAPMIIRSRITNKVV